MLLRLWHVVVPRSVGHVAFPLRLSLKGTTSDEGAVAEEQPRRRVAGVAGEAEPLEVALLAADAERVRHAHVPAARGAVGQADRALAFQRPGGSHRCQRRCCGGDQ